LLLREKYFVIIIPQAKSEKKDKIKSTAMVTGSPSDILIISNVVFIGDNLEKFAAT
jgi:hypothetical protein